MITVVNALVDVGLLAMLAISGLMLVRCNSPLNVTILNAIYSFAICSLFVIMDAVDVAFTEAAVGAGISTVLFLCVVHPDDEPDRLFAWPGPLATVVALATGLLLVFGTFDMPLYGDPQAPVHTHLVPRFLEDSAAEIGIPNVVTSVLASYRGYDTLGEVVVIFTAGTSVLILLAAGCVRRNPQGGRDNLISNPILRVVVPRVIPLVVLFALYVQFHGDYGPGGGFQAGVILGAGLITLALLTDSRMMQRIISERWIIRGMAGGVLVYGLVGVASMLAGGKYLDYSVLARSSTDGQHLGILLIEVGVGTTVAFTMLSLFVSFNRVRRTDD